MSTTPEQLAVNQRVLVWRGWTDNPHFEIIQRIFDNHVETNSSAHVWHKDIYLTSKDCADAIRVYANGLKARYDKMADEVEGL